MPPLKNRKTTFRTDSLDWDLASRMSDKVIGQAATMTAIAPFVEMYHAGLAPEGRPAGVFLLLGPTGTGKTRTVEALAEVLHGSARNILKLDCGEFQMDHEVAKLIGAPPGYLGHRETQPALSQHKLNSVTSERSSLGIVLFDEIEKAAPSLTRLLLGVLDRGTLRLGDNSMVNFERTLIFLTSNLGAAEMSKHLNPGFGFEKMTGRDSEALSNKLESVAGAAARRKFSPEFLNRIDVISTFHPLGDETLGKILDLQLAEIQRHILSRLGERGFMLKITAQGKDFLLRHGTSTRYGARELKRTLHRHITQPIAAMVMRGQVPPGGAIRIDIAKEAEALELRAA
jgi:ATP-dependent Clp protease ATP-binding subunit ClpA